MALHGGDAPSVDPRTGDLDFGAGAARVSVPGMDPVRTIRLEADVLAANDLSAQRNRAHFAAHGVTALNLLSGPGAGKTTLLVATLERLRHRAPGRPVAVIEGDQQTSHDADRIRAAGAPAIQVNTGKGCHLDAPMVEAAFARLPIHGHAHPGHDHHAHPAPASAHAHPHDSENDADRHVRLPAADPGALLFIENVGNLVCPAMWDLGEAAKVAILSVTEGDDKPAKYPDLFASAALLVIAKIDLLPHVDFDVERCIAFARGVRPDIGVLRLSARTGEGMDAWIDWVLALAARTQR